MRISAVASHGVHDEGGRKVIVSAGPLMAEQAVGCVRVFVTSQAGVRQVAEWAMPQCAGPLKAGDVVVVELVERRQRPR